MARSKGPSPPSDSPGQHPPPRSHAPIPSRPPTRGGRSAGRATTGAGPPGPPSERWAGGRPDERERPAPPPPGLAPEAMPAPDQVPDLFSLLAQLAALTRETQL